METLEKLEKRATEYLERTADWYKLHKNSERVNNSTLEEVADFATTVAESCRALRESLTPLFTRLEGASNEQIDQASTLLAEQMQISPQRVRQLVDSFVGIVGNKNPDKIKYNYDQVVQRAPKGGSSVQRNFATLRDKGEWSSIDELLTKTLKVDQLVDIRNVMSLSDQQLALLSEYLRRTNLSLFDLLFQPSVTIEYPPELVRAIVAREMGLNALSQFYDWIGKKSITLREKGNVSEMKLEQEKDRYDKLIEDVENVFNASVEREKRSKETYVELKQQKKALEERLKMIETDTEELKRSSKFLGDSQRIADYYSKLEARYITNIVDHLNDIKNTELSTEQDLAPIKQLGFQTDQIQQLNDDYREYRIILYNYLKRLLL